MLAEAATATNTRASIVAALQQAAAATGADFAYLLGTATRESSLNPAAKAGTSSAAGLFQFVEQTWLGAVKNYGAKHGLGSLANAITQGPDGKFRTSTPADRSAILALRTDPQIASLMEGEFAQATRSNLEGSLGRSVCDGELYAAHFLGADAACRLIRMKDSQPEAAAASAFPAAADANRSVFFHRDGTAKTVREVYDWALRQPNAGTSSVIAAKPTKANPAPTVSSFDLAATPDVDSILASVASWGPGHGFFRGDEKEGSSAETPFLLSPGVMNLLTSVSPVAVRHTAS
jgi:hypothetical protein